MKICPKCSAENPEEAKFCNLCYQSFQSDDGEGRPVDVRDTAAGESSASVRCPNCEGIGPANEEFCGRCGFDFTGTKREPVEPESRASEAREKLDVLERETRELREKPLTVTADSEIAELMRRLAESLDQGYRPRVRATGKEPIALTVKLLARLSEEFRAKDRQLWVQPHFVDSEPVRHLEELEVELILVVSARSG